MYSAVLPPTVARAALSTTQPEVQPGYCGPGCEVSYPNGRRRVRYSRFGSDGVEPLVLLRSFRRLDENRHERWIFIRAPTHGMVELT